MNGVIIGTGNDSRWGEVRRELQKPATTRLATLRRELDLSQSLLEEPKLAKRVDEGRCCAGRVSEGERYLTTTRVFSCKLITLHHPDRLEGVLGHLATSELSANQVLETMAAQLGLPFEELDIVIAAGTGQGVHHSWHKLEELEHAALLKKPRSLSIDRHFLSHRRERQGRGFALDLRRGVVHELDGWLGWLSLPQGHRDDPGLWGFQSEE